VLGDMCIKNEEYNMEYLIDRLNGKINVISGNHCYLPYYNHSKIEMQNGLVSKYGFWLSHCPIHPNEMRKKTHNIHGHIHIEVIDDPRYICVSCEQVNYTPVLLDELIKNLK
jgi:calcineurin-like phosphoesterase family protein